MWPVYPNNGHLESHADVHPIQLPGPAGFSRQKGAVLPQDVRDPHPA